MRIAEAEFKQWDSDQLTDWIVGLDINYEKYEQGLRANLKNEGVTGELLSELDKNDLHRFGVNMLKDKIAILKNIKRITEQEAKHAQFAQPQAYEGGNPAPTAYI